MSTVLVPFAGAYNYSEWSCDAEADPLYPEGAWMAAARKLCSTAPKDRWLLWIRLETMVYTVLHAHFNGERTDAYRLHTSEDGKHHDVWTCGMNVAAEVPTLRVEIVRLRHRSPEGKAWKSFLKNGPQFVSPTTPEVPTMRGDPWWHGYFYQAQLLASTPIDL